MKLCMLKIRKEYMRVALGVGQCSYIGDFSFFGLKYLKKMF